MPWIWIYPPLYFCLRILSPILGLFNPKIRKGRQMRRPLAGVLPWLAFPANSQPIWFHCASGEFEYAKPVIRELKKEFPQCKILVTYFSPSVERSIAQTPEVDFSCPTPWDTSSHWNKFLKHHQPKALLIARTDLWPMMIHRTAAKKIPTLLFSKTVNKHKLGLLSFFSLSMMKRIRDIFCVSEADRELLAEAMGSSQNIHAVGDTRYDQCLYRLQHGQTLKPLPNFNRPILVAGSTWPGDEAWLLDLIPQQMSNTSFIIAPHEPTEAHLQDLEKRFSKKGLLTQRYSLTESWNPSAVLLIDRVGILADLYKWGQYAFIGGSVDRSVHSVMEPLAQGLLCFVGPFYRNNREAILFSEQQIEDMTPVQVVRSADEFQRRFQSLSPSWTKDHQFGLQMAARQKTGASKIVVKWLKNNVISELSTQTSP